METFRTTRVRVRKVAVASVVTGRRTTRVAKLKEPGISQKEEGSLQIEGFTKTV